MKRRFNYTERKKIGQDRIEIILHRTATVAESFDAVVRLDGMSLSDEARVYMEAYQRRDVVRYDFGTVADTVQPHDTGLSRLAHHEIPRFRVLVVDESNTRGLILASADGIRTTQQVRRRSILPVDFQDLGRQVWKVDYGGDEPVLVLNEKIPNIHNMAKTDARFQMYVYPSVVRDIFNHMLFVEKVYDVEDPPQQWHVDWLQFARRFLTADTWSQLDLQDGEPDSATISAWIDRVVEGFCWSRSKEWLRLLSLEEVG